MNITVEVSGSGPALVLVHGWGMNSRVWDSVRESLGQRYQLHLVNLPGHGGSGFDASNTDINAWSEAVLDAVPAAAVWIGWSLGGLVALNAALMKPAAVSSLILLASTPKFVQQRGWRCAMPVSVFDEFYRALSVNVHRTLMRFLSLQIQQSDHGRETLSQLKAGLALLPEAQQGALQAGLALLRDTDLRAQLSALQCPVLWLLGERDTLVPLALKAALEDLHPQASIEIISRAGHAPMLSHPQQSLQLIGEFLSS